jgi:large subunit ribosomal protein L31e
VPTEPGHYVYVIPLSRVYWGRRTNRADRAVKLVRRFVQRHTKVDHVLITNEVNEYIWQRGREKPPRRIKVVVTVKEVEEEGEKKKLAIVRLAGEKLKPGKYEVKAEKKQ